MKLNGFAQNTIYNQQNSFHIKSRHMKWTSIKTFLTETYHFNNILTTKHSFVIKNIVW